MKVQRIRERECEEEEDLRRGIFKESKGNSIRCLGSHVVAMGVSSGVRSCKFKSGLIDQGCGRCSSLHRISLSVRLYVSDQSFLITTAALCSGRDTNAEFKWTVIKKNPESTYLIEKRIGRKIYRELAFSLSMSSILKQNLRAYKCYFK